MSHLLRGHAPISDEGWARIDAEASDRLGPGLAARRLVDFQGPQGWQHSATSLGRSVASESGLEGVSMRTRRVLPMVELAASFTVSREELREGDRGAEDADFEDLARAANQMAEAENSAVFNGLEDADMAGIGPASPHDPLPVPDDPASYTETVAGALDQLKRSGVAGPYGLALSREEWTRVVEGTEHGGYPLLRHLRSELGGPIVWTPGLEGAVVLSLRGGDFLLDVGQDLVVGYEAHDADEVRLYIEESISFRAVGPEAAVRVS